MQILNVECWNSAVGISTDWNDAISYSAVSVSVLSRPPCDKIAIRAPSSLAMDGGHGILVRG